MESILITGGAGFIGSNLIREILQKKRFRIICFDCFDEYYPKAYKICNLKAFQNDENFLLIDGDILHKKDLQNLPHIDIIIHLAAKTGVRASISDPFNYHQVNTTGTHILLEFAKVKGIKKFIFASSSSVYGINKDLPWTEDAELKPISPYASSKASAEIIGRVYSNLYAIQFISLRLFTVYGPGQRPDLAIQHFFNCILNNQPISVFGDGESIRDYTFIEDVLIAIQNALDYSKTKYEVFNIGSQNPISLNELISEIESICKRRALINELPMQIGDVPSTFADISKAKLLLNYNPRHTLREGLTKHFNWLNHKDLKLI